MTGYAGGNGNGRWAGDAITYHGMHLRVRCALGSASEYPCVECANPAAQWSYDHADPDEIQSDDGAYSLNVDRYAPRCISCHKKFDLSFKPQKPDAPIDPETLRRLRAEGVGVPSIAVRLGVPRRHVERALDGLGLPRIARKGRMPQPRCNQPTRPWRGAVSSCAKPQGHTGKHEARRRPKTYSTAAEAGTYVFEAAAVPS